MIKLNVALESVYVNPNYIYFMDEWNGRAVIFIRGRAGKLIVDESPDEVMALIEKNTLSKATL
jgi:hypothetical protein